MGLRVDGLLSTPISRAGTLKMDACIFDSVPINILSICPAYRGSALLVEVGRLNNNYQFLKNCVWHGPRGFSRKPALYSVYGHQLHRLFQEILQIPTVTSAEALEYLEYLKGENLTTLADVVEVYVFLQTFHINSCVECSSLNLKFLTENRVYAPQQIACIAVPSPSGPRLEWKMPSQCV